MLTSDANRAAYDEAATRAIIDALRGTAKRFVYTSGCLLYGATGDTPATGDSPLYPLDLVRFRQALEGDVLAAAADGVHAIVIRPAWVYGNWGGTAMMMYGVAKEHGAARYVGDGTNRWTTVHADDLADLYLLALDKAPAASIFNGAHGAVIPLVAIARAASEGAGAEGRVAEWPLEDARQALWGFADAIGGRTDRHPRARGRTPGSGFRAGAGRVRRYLLRDSRGPAQLEAIMNHGRWPDWSQFG